MKVGLNPVNALEHRRENVIRRRLASGLALEQLVCGKIRKLHPLRPPYGCSITRGTAKKASCRCGAPERTSSTGKEG